MIKRLFLKKENGSTDEVSSLDLNENGVVGARETHHYRQLLLLPESTLREFNLKPGEMKEDIVVELPFNLNELESGTILRVGSAEVRLTFHCEPCSKIKDLVNLKQIMFKRGFLCSVDSSGIVDLNSSIEILNRKAEFIPYKIADRIKWYLDKCQEPIAVTDLVAKIGLSNSYCRAIPNMVKKRPDIDSSKILYSNSTKKHINSKAQLVLDL